MARNGKGSRRHIGGPEVRKAEDPGYLAFGLGAGFVGPPVVAGAFSGTQAMALRSYLNPGAIFSASLVAFMTGYHLLLPLVLNWTALKWTATSFSPAPRKPPTPTINAVILPSLSTRTSMISPILLSE